MYNKILIPLDGSELAECVLPHVENIVKGGGAKSVALVRVVEPFRMLSGGDSVVFSENDIKNINSETRAVAESYLKEVVSRLELAGADILTNVMEGKPAEAIADYSTKNEVDLIVIATHGHSGISRWVMGSVADRLVRSSCVPVLMVRAPGCAPGM
jgi:nucleotide-binding universal stress UspA family protein